MRRHHDVGSHRIPLALIGPTAPEQNRAFVIRRGAQDVGGLIDRMRCDVMFHGWSAFDGWADRVVEQGPQFAATHRASPRSNVTP